MGGVGLRNRGVLQALRSNRPDAASAGPWQALDSTVMAFATQPTLPFHFQQLRRATAGVVPFCFALTLCLHACGGSTAQRADRDRGLADAPLRADLDTEPLRGDLAAGVRKLKDGDVDDAIASLQRHLAAHPNSAHAQYHLGLCALEQARRDDARKHLERAFTLNPQMHGAASMLGAMYLEAGEDVAALRLLREAWQIAPQDVRVLVNLAAACLRRGLWSEAIEAYQEARELAPGHGTLLYDFALARMERLEYAEAIELLDEALLYRPHFALARAAKVVCLQELGRTDIALDLARTSIAQVADPSPDLYIALGRVLVMVGKVAEARGAFEKAADIDGEHAAAQLALGEVLDATGDKKGAIAWYARYLKNPARTPADGRRIRERHKQLQAVR